MQFDWDDANIQHIARHEVTPEEVEQLFENDPMDAGTVIRNGEERVLYVGETDSGRALLVVITERGDQIRTVTARPARHDERAYYTNYKATPDDQDTTDP